MFWERSPFVYGPRMIRDDARKISLPSHALMLVADNMSIVEPAPEQWVVLIVASRNLAPRPSVTSMQSPLQPPLACKIFLPEQGLESFSSDWHRNIVESSGIRTVLADSPFAASQSFGTPFQYCFFPGSRSWRSGF